jgi:hypothetical protein
MISLAEITDRSEYSNALHETASELFTIMRNSEPEMSDEHRCSVIKVARDDLPFSIPDDDETIVEDLTNTLYEQIREYENIYDEMTDADEYEVDDEYDYDEDSDDYDYYSEEDEEYEDEDEDYGPLWFDEKYVYVRVNY